MPYEDQFSQYPTMKGIALELPFVKFKYVKVDRGETEKPKNARIIDLTVPSEEKAPISYASRVIVTKEAEVTTLGIDPMISKASVIHELAYGRIETAQDYNLAASYAASYEPSQHSLDIII
jgi:hypothetical protein